MRAKPNQALIEFTGGLAHELANLFTAAAGNLSLLESAADDGASGRLAFNDARRAYARGFALVTRLKAISGRQALNNEHADIDRLIATVLDETRAALPPDINVDLRLAKKACIAFIDREKFCGAIAALFVNAFEAMKNGGTLTIETEIVNPDDKQEYIRIAVRDNGAVMMPEVAARAFDPLTTTKPSGFRHGWGLALCEGFVRQSGGFIELESEPKHGACVSLFLPRAKPAG